MKKTLITGIIGQDGLYIAELFIEKGFAVHGNKWCLLMFNNCCIDYLLKDRMKMI